jgi:hypothetical protein
MTNICTPEEISAARDYAIKTNEALKDWLNDSTIKRGDVEDFSYLVSDDNGNGGMSLNVIMLQENLFSVEQDNGMDLLHDMTDDEGLKLWSENMLLATLNDIDNMEAQAKEERLSW